MVQYIEELLAPHIYEDVQLEDLVALVENVLDNNESVKDEMDQEISVDQVIDFWLLEPERKEYYFKSGGVNFRLLVKAVEGKVEVDTQ